MTAPEVSVVIPTYNYSKYIGEAIRSVYDQTLQDFEIIVVDDGSTDNTKEIVQSFGEKIRYFYQSQQGPAKARNKGIMESRGKFVAFLDSDDVWLPTKLEKQVKKFGENSGTGMVLTDNFLFDEAGIYREYVNKKGYLLTGDVVANILINSGVVTPTVMVRRDVFARIGMFEEDLLIAEDDNMWIRIAVEYGVDIVDESLAKIRDHRGRTMRVSDKLIESVERNVEYLSTRYGPKVTARILPLAPKKLHQLYFSQGYGNFEIGNNREARKLFKKALSYNPNQRKTIVYIAATYVPRWTLSFVRLLKKLVRPRKYNLSIWFRQN
jgi:glycosyltransferase involved in cell wall biosynthesis